MTIAITIYPRGQQFPSFWILRPWVSLVFVTCLTELRTQPLFEITKESMSSKLLVRCIDLTDDVEELTQGRLQSPPNSLMNKFLSQSSFSFNLDAPPSRIPILNPGKLSLSPLNYSSFSAPLKPTCQPLLFTHMSSKHLTNRLSLPYKESYKIFQETSPPPLPPLTTCSFCHKEANGNPPQYSWLGNPMDKGDWWVTALKRVRHNLTPKQQTIFCIRQRTQPLQILLQWSYVLGNIIMPT